jgi:hypothetical protein
MNIEARLREIEQSLADGDSAYDYVHELIGMVRAALKGEAAHDPSSGPEALVGGPTDSGRATGTGGTEPTVPGPDSLPGEAEADQRHCGRRDRHLPHEWQVNLPTTPYRCPGEAEGTLADGLDEPERIYTGEFPLAWLGPNEVLRSAGDGTWACEIIAADGSVRRINVGDPVQVRPEQEQEQ